MYIWYALLTKGLDKYNNLQKRVHIFLAAGQASSSKILKTDFLTTCFNHYHIYIVPCSCHFHGSIVNKCFGTSVDLKCMSLILFFKYKVF